jgi:formylmethanofuran dehydrogenase subunit D
MHILLITGRSIIQGRGKEKGKFSDIYYQSTTLCEVDPQYLKKLKIKENENIQIKTENGSIILKPIESKQAPHRGIIFVSYGPIINQLTNPQTHGSGMPNLKGMPAEISTTRNPVTRL